MKRKGQIKMVEKLSVEDATRLNISFRNEEVHVFYGLSDNNEDDVHLSFFFGATWHNLIRRKSDTFENTIKRMAKCLTHKQKKKSLKKKCSDDFLPSGEVSLNGSNLDLSIYTNGEWVTGMKLMLQCCCYEVVVNPPIVTKLTTFPTKLIPLSIPVVSSCIVKYAEHENIDYSWFIELPEIDVWISDGPIIFLNSFHVGYRIKCYCTAWRMDGEGKGEGDGNKEVRGRTTVNYLKGTVTGDVNIQSKQLQQRESFIENSSIHQEVKGYKSPPSPNPDHYHYLSHILRVCTFNTLSLVYTSKLESDLGSDVCDIEYRMILVAKELCAYKTDITLLQECDKHVFEEYLCPLLLHHGYEGHYTPKSSGAEEGCAIFVNSKQFYITSRIDITLRHVIDADISLQAFFRLCPDLCTSVMNKLGSIAQISLLRHIVTDKIVIVVNTHLYYHPDADWIRLIQIRAILQVVESISHILTRDHGEIVDLPFPYDLLVNIKSDRSNSNNSRCAQYQSLDGAGGAGVGVVIGGDLNSSPDSAAIEFLQGGHIDCSHAVWGNLSKYTKIDLNKLENIKMTIPQIKHSMNIISATGYPECTNYTQDFRDTLDYIFVNQEFFDVIRIAELPSLECLNNEENGALPTSQYPSDHLSLLVDIIIKSLY